MLMNHQHLYYSPDKVTHDTAMSQSALLIFFAIWNGKIAGMTGGLDLNIISMFSGWCLLPQSHGK